MATGDQTDVLQRLRSYLPPWFGDGGPIITALLEGLAYAGSFVFSLYLYAKLQTRIKTATSGFLDFIAGDLFGTRIQRKPGQSDASFRNTILINLFRERATRRAIKSVLADLTGTEPKIVEPSRPKDCGGYGVGGVGYLVAGAYGSLVMPYQAFVQAVRPANANFPNLAGYGVSLGGYGAGAVEYAPAGSLAGVVTDAEIYAAVDLTKPVGSTVWVQISNNPPPVPAYLDFFMLDSSEVI